jgi:uncharacterized protein YegP (UPF0339 family)
MSAMTDADPVQRASDSPDYATIKNDKNGQFYATLHSGGNHEVVAMTESYHNRDDLIDTLARYFPQFES